MGRAYNFIDADGHILEPLDLWDKYIDPKFRDHAPRLVKGDNKGMERLVIEEHRSAANAAWPDRRGRRAARHRGGGQMAYKDGQAGRVRSARAHPGHGCRRHRRGLSVSDPRAVRRRDG